MSNETGTSETGTELTGQTSQTQQSSATGEQFDLSQFVNTDGSFKEGWQKGLAPEDLRDDGFYTVFKDIKGLVKTAGTNAKLIGKKGIIPPGDNATPEEISAFHQALGAPKASTDYKVEIPEAMKPYFDEKFTQEALAGFHKEGFTQKHIDAVMAAKQKEIALGMEFKKKMEAEAENKANESIHTQFGDKFESMMHSANKMVNDNVEDGEAKSSLLEAINKPEVRQYIVPLLASIASKFAEDNPHGADEGGSASSIDTQIAALRATPGFYDGTLARTNGAKHQEIVDAIDKLYKQRYPEPRKD
jgi:hypothetical protein